MADVIWTPDPLAVADGSRDYRVLVCVETSDLVYVLLEGAVPAGSGVAGERVPLWQFRVTTALGDLPFRRGGMSWSERSFFHAQFDRLGADVDAQTVTLVRDDETVMAARVVRLVAGISPQGQADGIWVADPDGPFAGLRDYRLLVCVEGRDRLYTLIEGPVPLPDQVPPDGGQRWVVRAGTDSGYLPVKLQGASIPRSSRTLVYASFEAPEAKVRTLEVTLQRDNELLLAVRAVRLVDIPGRR